MSVPKNGDGGGATLLVAATSPVTATVSQGTAYWIELVTTTTPGFQQTMYLKSAPLVPDATITTLDTTTSVLEPPGQLAIVGGTIFGAGPNLEIIPLDGGEPIRILGFDCEAALGTPNGVYCGGPPITLVTALGDAGTVSSEASGARGFAVDESNVYWANDVASGSVVAAPLLGGSYVVIGYDDGPIAVAVDSNAVYWSDSAGNIERALKVK